MDSKKAKRLTHSTAKLRLDFGVCNQVEITNRPDPVVHPMIAMTSQNAPDTPSANHQALLGSYEHLEPVRQRKLVAEAGSSSMHQPTVLNFVPRARSSSARCHRSRGNPP